MFFECCIVANCSLGVFVGECGYSRNVCNVFILCMLHIHRRKVWFLPCKSMVFGVQKGGFCIAKVWFLFFECYVVAIRQLRFGNLYATLWQSIRSIIGRPFAAVGVRFIVPVSTNTPKLYCVFMPLALQFTAPYPHPPTKWRYNSHNFYISKPFGLD